MGQRAPRFGTGRVAGEAAPVNLHDYYILLIFYYNLILLYINSIFITSILFHFHHFLKKMVLHRTNRFQTKKYRLIPNPKRMGGADSGNF